MTTGATLNTGATGVIARFHGHSRCQVMLCREGGRYLVRKVSGGAGYDARLAAQMDKQRHFGALGFACPAVLASGKMDGQPDGRFFFDMEYIAGRDAITILETSTLPQLCRFAGSLVDVLELLADTADGDLPEHLFTDKIAAVAEAGFPFAVSDDLQDAHRAAAARLRRLDWRGIPCSASHGDMTLENIIQKEDGTVVFIDLLDGELSSFWLDIAKLYQDVQSLWFLRHFDESAGSQARYWDLRLTVQFLHEQLQRALMARWPQAIARLPQLLAFQLFRIFPYCTDPGILRFLVDAIASLPLERLSRHEPVHRPSAERWPF